MPIATYAAQLLTNTTLSKLMQNKLAQLSPLDNPALTDNVWRFQYSKHIITVDFTLFEQPSVQFAETVTTRFDGHYIPLNLIEFAKLIWLDVTFETKVRKTSYYQIIDKLALLFHYLHVKQLDQLDALHVEEFYGLCLTHNVTKEGVKKRLSAPAYITRFDPLTLKKFQQILNRYGVTNVVSGISEKKALSALNETCLSIMDMTRLDYKAGNSFNYLGLDVGKHYIDHCLLLFEKHCPYISAFRHTYKALFDAQQGNENLKICKNSTTLILGKVLCGQSVKAIRESLGSSKPAEIKIIAIESFVHQHFFEAFTSTERIVNAFKLDTINRIAKECQLPERYDAQEFIRSLLFVDVFGKHGKSKQAIWQEYQATLCKTALPDEAAALSVTLPEFESITANILSELRTQMPSDIQGIRAFLRSQSNALPNQLDKRPLNGIEYFKKIASLIEDAGATGFVGLTGWRASEYGFSMSNIDVDINPDPLDNQYTPWRFHVRWKVPKTSSNTPLPREITLGSYILAAQLAHLNLADKTDPAIYQATTATQKEDSAPEIQKAMPNCWANFVNHYSVFKDIEAWKYLKDKVSLTKKDETALNTLESTYRFDEAPMRAIIKMKNDLNDALPRVLMAQEPDPRKTFGIRLRAYIDGNTPSDITALFDKHLSEETKNKLKSGEVELDKAGVRFVRSEFLGDAVYATPHAFRHIFAEAVLRRYRGDVGRFIRSHFKHLDERFFMAYLRDKEYRVIQQIATRHVINSVVRLHMDSIQDEHREYAGGVDRFLSKAVAITHVYSDEEQKEKLAQAAVKRVLAIKSNPWASCLLRDGTQQNAKCSVNGEPQRQNAQPRLCLGCLNADIAEGNFNGIVVYTMQDVAACRNPDLPWFIKESNYHTVTLALKRVEELRHNSNNPIYDKFISRLKETLLIADAQRGHAA
ncbi:hypothetical protein [Rheinheimera soli]|uniref:Phage integrase family protein n=1 Tax=Rheinheimera soli TaxID=443616 RepID=A0ABU1W1V1_9GAMM|nr:hypothetical protein [Rheinheimera soli]MDR7121688.1 hypothetical protein [Rheinheimera soli]